MREKSGFTTLHLNFEGPLTFQVIIVLIVAIEKLNWKQSQSESIDKRTDKTSYFSIQLQQ